jgi:phage terminase Nu1 subunit (DNA packaging protein)
MAKRKSAAAEFEALADDDSYGTGEIFDLKGIAHVFGMTRYAVKECVAHGAPVIHRPRSKLDQWRIAAGDFAAWLVRDSIAESNTPAGRYHDAKTQLAMAHLDRVEMANREFRDSNLTTMEARQLFAEERSAIARHLNAIPAAVVKALATLSVDARRDAATLEAVIEDAIADAMNAICNDGGENVPQAA